MAIIGTLLISVLMVAVVPKVTAIFESLDRALPWYTPLLIVVSDFVAGYWWLVIIAGHRRHLVLSPLEDARRRAAEVGHRSASRRRSSGGSCRCWPWRASPRTLATLLAAGVPLLKAMDIVQNVLGNALLEKVVDEAIGSIREGESIAEPLKRSGQFPPIVTHMIAVGEKSGQLEQMLENVADAYDAAGRDQRAGADQPARAADDRGHGRRSASSRSRS